MMTLGVEGHWLPVRDGDYRSLALYLRHYSSKKARQRRRRRPADKNQNRIVGPAEKQIYLTVTCDAVFAWRHSRYRDDGQAGVECSIFRNEGPLRSSDLIREADELAWQRWPDIDRHFTFVDPKEVRSSNPGYCFLMAGWRRCGTTKGGLLIFERLRW